MIVKSSLSDYSDVYMPVQGTILIAAQGRDNPNNGDKEVVFKNCWVLHLLIAYVK